MSVFLWVVLVIVVGVVGLYLAGLIYSYLDGPMPKNCSDADIAREAQRDKNRAIRWYRGLHGAGLLESTKAVEAMIEQKGT